MTVREDIEKRIRAIEAAIRIRGEPKGRRDKEELARNKKALATFADKLSKLERDKPEVVCLCGSTRFADQHAIKRWELEREGKVICVMINYLPGWYAHEQGWNDDNDHFGEQFGNKEILDELHFRKIDLADRVFVLNVGGYIGESTAAEIAYAEKTGKQVEYLEPVESGE